MSDKKTVDLLGYSMEIANEIAVTTVDEIFAVFSGWMDAADDIEINEACEQFFHWLSVKYPCGIKITGGVVPGGANSHIRTKMQ